MALRCREGDLAIVLHGTFTGYLVTVGKFQGDLSGLYNAESVNEAWEVCCKDILEQYPSDITMVVCEDRYLQPVRPPKIDKTTETKQEIEA